MMLSIVNIFLQNSKNNDNDKIINNNFFKKNSLKYCIKRNPINMYLVLFFTFIKGCRIQTVNIVLGIQIYLAFKGVVFQFKKSAE